MTFVFVRKHHFQRKNLQITSSRVYTFFYKIFGDLNTALDGVILMLEKVSSILYQVMDIPVHVYAT